MARGTEAHSRGKTALTKTTILTTVRDREKVTQIKSAWTLIRRPLISTQKICSPLTQTNRTREARHTPTRRP